MAADTAHQDEPAARPLEVLEGRVYGSEDAEQVRLELTAVVLERQGVERADDAEAGVRDDHVDLAEGRSGFAGRPLQVAIPADVAGDDRSPAAGLLDFSGEGLEPVSPAGQERHVRALGGELVGERGPDARGGSRDEDCLADESLPSTSHRRRARDSEA